MQSSLGCNFIPFPNFPNTFSFHEHRPLCFQSTHIEILVSEWALFSYVSMSFLFNPQFLCFEFSPHFSTVWHFKCYLWYFILWSNVSTSPGKSTYCLSFVWGLLLYLFVWVLLTFSPVAQHFKQGYINNNSYYVFLLLLLSTSISYTPSNCWPLITLVIFSYVTLALTNKPIQLNCTLKITNLYDLCDLLRLLTAEAKLLSAIPSTFPHLGPLMFFIPDQYYLSFKVHLYSSV